MRILYISAICAVLISGCASGSAVRTSQNSALIQATAAPICGSVGASQVAERQAAIETLRAGYDKYVITGGAAQNNVRVSQVPARATTYGNIYGNTWTANTSYSTNTIVSGSHAQQFSIMMFRNTDGGAENAISAREVLGADWQKIVANGVVTC
jgi:hypothetical protein